MLERIAARRAELDGLEEQLVKQLAEVRGERDELVVAERVVQRISEQGFGVYLSLAPALPEARVGGRSVLLIPARAGDGNAEVLPADYQRLLVIVREARSRFVRSARCSGSRSRCGARWSLCERS